MNISTDFRRISPDYNKPKSGYEWWYYDGMSMDGKYGFVIIFYHDNPFSTNKIKELERGTLDSKPHPAVSVSVYENNKPVYYSFLEFEENDFEWNQDEKTLTVGGDSCNYAISGDSLSFELTLNQQLASGHKIKGRISGKGILPEPALIQAVGEGDHRWDLILPIMDIKAEIDLLGSRGEERICFQGKGYHDHNSGYEPMKESFKNWYWGRYHFDDFTLVYYLMQKREVFQVEGWLIDEKNQSVMEYFSEANLDYYTRNWFGMNSARKIELIEGQVAVNIQCKSKIDDGPFYQRYFGDAIIKYKDQVYGAHGISEYINPQNIYKKQFWPFVHMRLRYMSQNPHWVQKWRLLYPWTW